MDNVAFGSGAAVAPSFAAAPPTARGGFHELNFVGRTFTDLLRCSFVACLTMSSLTSSPARARCLSMVASRDSLSALHVFDHCLCRCATHTISSPSAKTSPMDEAGLNLICPYTRLPYRGSHRSLSCARLKQSVLYGS